MLATEYTLENTQEKIMRKAEEAVSRDIGRRISPADVQESKNAATSVNERGGSGCAGRLGGGAGRGAVPQGVSLLKINGDGRLAIVLSGMFYYGIELVDGGNVRVRQEHVNCYTVNFLSKKLSIP